MPELNRRDELMPILSHKDSLVGLLKSTASKDLKNNENPSQLPERTDKPFLSFSTWNGFSCLHKEVWPKNCLLSFLIFRLLRKESEYTPLCTWSAVFPRLLPLHSIRNQLRNLLLKSLALKAVILHLFLIMHTGVVWVWGWYRCLSTVPDAFQRDLLTS